MIGAMGREMFDGQREKNKITIREKGNVRGPDQYIRVFSGIKFWPLDPRPDEIDILDIAHALSLNCRWGGHSLRFFSIAQHSCIVHDMLPRCLRRVGLLHDASEGYLLDMPRPIKYQIPEYIAIEEKLMLCIADRFGFGYPELERIKGADDLALYLEKIYLFNDGMAREVLSDRAVDFFFTNKLDGQDMIFHLKPWSPDRAELEFLQRFYDLPK